jgi:hypothetical protein
MAFLYSAGGEDGRAARLHTSLGSHRQGEEKGADYPGWSDTYSHRPTMKINPDTNRKANPFNLSGLAGAVNSLYQTMLLSESNLLMLTRRRGEASFIAFGDFDTSPTNRAN